MHRVLPSCLQLVNAGFGLVVLAPILAFAVCAWGQGSTFAEPQATPVAAPAGSGAGNCGPPAAPSPVRNGWTAASPGFSPSGKVTVGGGASFSPWSRELLDLFGVGARVRRIVDAGGYGMGMRGGGNDSALQAGGGFGSFAGGAQSGNSSDYGALFQERSGSGRSFGFGSGANAMGGFPGLGSPARGGPDMRMLSSSGGAHSSYRDMFSNRASGPGVGIFPGGATYSSGRFGSGMFNFSATALYGSASRPGATGFATPKNAGPTVALKLTF